MKIVGLDELTPNQLADELKHGGKFVMYKFCISLLIVTFQRPSSIYFIRSDQSRVPRGIGWSLLSLLLGWWGIPWGPIYTIGAVWSNCSGGTDVTNEVVSAMLEAAKEYD